MKIKEMQIKSLLYDLIDIQKDVLFNGAKLIKYEYQLKEFAKNICDSIEFEDMDDETFNSLLCSPNENHGDDDKIDYVINNGNRYYRIELDVREGSYEGMGGRITVLNNSDNGYYGYRVYFSTITLKREYDNRRVINGIRVDEYLDGKTVKECPIKIDRSFVLSSIYR